MTQIRWEEKRQAAHSPPTLSGTLWQEPHSKGVPLSPHHTQLTFLQIEPVNTRAGLSTKWGSFSVPHPHTNPYMNVHSQPFIHSHSSMHAESLHVYSCPFWTTVLFSVLWCHHGSLSSLPHGVGTEVLRLCRRGGAKRLWMPAEQTEGRVKALASPIS